MNKKFITILFLCLLTFGLTWNVYAEEFDSSNYESQKETTYTSSNNEGSYRIILEDDANLLTEKQEKDLRKHMTVLSEYGNILFKSISLNTYGDAATYAKEFYHTHFGNYVSGALFLIDMDTREIYLFMDGDIREKITDAKAYSITDNIYRYASDRDYYSCAAGAFSQMKALLEGQKIAEPMRYASNVVIAITIAFLINFLYVFAKSGIRKARNTEIINNCNINFQMGEANAVKTGTHRVYSPVSESSGGSSGGGGGGGSSGGGGGHSF